MNVWREKIEGGRDDNENGEDEYVDEEEKKSNKVWSSKSHTTYQPNVFTRSPSHNQQKNTLQTTTLYKIHNPYNMNSEGSGSTW